MLGGDAGYDAPGPAPWQDEVLTCEENSVGREGPGIYVGPAPTDRPPPAGQPRGNQALIGGLRGECANQAEG